MQQTELKNLVFERFEQRRLDLLKKRNQFQQELDQGLHQLREAYGDTAVLSLGNLTLTLSQPQKPTSSPTEPLAVKQKPRSRRKRRQLPGEPSITSILATHVPGAVIAVSDKSAEFRSKDILDHLVDVAKLKVSHENVSLFLSQHAKELGLGVEKRVAGDRFPRPTNFFHLLEKVKKSDRVDWNSSILAALKGLQNGLNPNQLTEKLQKSGIPEAKIKGPRFRGAVARLVDQGKVVLEANAYRLV